MCMTSQRRQTAPMQKQSLLRSTALDAGLAWAAFFMAALRCPGIVMPEYAL